jgi:hypothetical protein
VCTIGNCQLRAEGALRTRGYPGAHIRFSVTPFHRSTRGRIAPPCVVNEPTAAHQFALVQDTPLRELSRPTGAPPKAGDDEPFQRPTAA